MKRFLMMLLAAVMLVSAVACSAAEEPSGGSAAPNEGEDGNSKVESAYQVGDKIEMGSYEQDGDTANGKEPISWYVLAVEEGRVLLISEYCLDFIPYHISEKTMTWESSYLRDWLAADFLHTAFTKDEKAKILLTDNLNPSNSQYGTPGGNPTKDKVFALSIEEAEKYLTEETIGAGVTAYAQSQSSTIHAAEDGTVWWWLRSPGRYDNTAAAVTNSEIDHDGFSLIANVNVVRPAMWIEE